MPASRFSGRRRRQRPTGRLGGRTAEPGSGAGRRRQLAAGLGLQALPAKVEGLRSKAERLVERGWALQTRPGVFTRLGTPAG
ncbi:hypothetical protein FEF34_00365 [Streptomyces marianii]|uniref:Uncharacterized protein n=1 Tax=Streptomyces marianii TaxID=1817406 RepID=A0A5R9DWC2_9ACTN|nr:hypothetical protein FEF34_00365 [Streptomyces marianii]